MRTQRNERAHLAQLLKSTVRRSSVGPDVCCLRHLMASVDDALPHVYGSAAGALIRDRLLDLLAGT